MMRVRARRAGLDVRPAPAPAAGTPGEAGADSLRSEVERLAAEFLERVDRECTPEALARAEAENPEALARFRDLADRVAAFTLDSVTPERLEEFRRLLSETEAAWREAAGSGARGSGTSAANGTAGGDFAVDRAPRPVQPTLFGPDPGSEPAAPAFRSPWEDWLDAAEVVRVGGLESWREALAEARAAGVCGFDLETTGLDPLQARVRLVQLAVPVCSEGERRLFAGDWRSPRPGSGVRVFVLDLSSLPGPERREALEALAGLVADPGVTKAGHNLKFDLAFLRSSLGGRRLACERLFDTMLASQLCAAGDFVPGGRWEKWAGEQGYSFARNDRGQELKTKLLDAHGHLVEFEHDNQKEIKPFYPAHSLQQVAHRHLEVWLDKDLQASDWRGELSEEQVRYAARDAAVLLPLYEVLRELLRRNGLVGVAKVEFDCLPAAVEVELAGMPFDAPRARELLRDAEGEAARRREALTFLASGADFRPRPKKGRKEGAARFNPDSGVDCVDLLRLLAEREGLSAGEKLAVGGEEFDLETRDETLSRLVQRLPEGSLVKEFAEELRAYRAAKKKADFLKKWLELLHPADDRLHPDLRQVNPQGVGRFSASNPNLQQVARGSDVRSLFRAPEGRKLVVADYSGIEMRIMAQLSGDRAMLAAFREGADVHRRTAAAVSGKREEEVTREERQMAKALNFGLIYGMTAETLRLYAETGYGVRMTLEEAEAAREAFFRTYPGVAAWHARQERRAYEDGFGDFRRHDFERGFYTERRPCARTLGGRLRVWPAVERERRGGGTYLRKAGSFTELFNTPDQGTGADMMKRAMGLLYRELLARGWEDVRIVATVHDELVLEAPEALAGEAVELLKGVMERAGAEFLPDVPVEVEAAVCRSWAEKA